MITRYKLEFTPTEASHWGKVDFVRDDSSILLHISLRPDEGVVVNTKQGGQWGTEERIVGALRAGQSYVLSLELSGAEVTLLLGDLPALNLLLPEPITADCSLKTDLLIMAHSTTPQPVVASREEVALTGPIVVELGGTKFSFRGLDDAAISFLKGTVAKFLSAHVMSPADGILFDFSRTGGAVGCILQAFFPRATIAVVLPELEFPLARENAALNGQSNALLLGDEETIRALTALGTKAKGSSLFSAGSAQSEVQEAKPSKVKSSRIPLLLAEHPVAAVVGRDIFQLGEPLAAALEAFLSTSNAAVCSLERQPFGPLTSITIGSRRGMKVDFVGNPWTLRYDRVGSVTQRDSRLDIGVAMYNTGKFIVPCLESLLAVDRGDIHVILVDDGSTDDSLQYVANAFANHPRLKVISKPNGGCASARNYARTMSDAAYVAFVDADDFVDPGMFPALLDAARLSGNEIVQSGFCFFDDATEQATASYELDQFKDWARTPINGSTCFRIPSELLIRGQPTIWRRVYRRDFLDNKGIWFPEHIRAFDDMIFHFMTLYYSRDVLHLDGVKYYYRQHAAQDIKQGDERHFYSLEMYRLIARRALREGWNSFNFFIPSLVNTLNWSLGALRDDLVQPFLAGGAELWVMLERAFGPGTVPPSALADVWHPDFVPAVVDRRRLLAASNVGFAAAYLDSPLLHPSTIVMARRLAAPFGPG
jgi:glycosyltransferase involved in cell wall biosynthesis